MTVLFAFCTILKHFSQQTALSHGLIRLVTGVGLALCRVSVGLSLLSLMFLGVPCMLSI